MGCIDVIGLGHGCGRPRVWRPAGQGGDQAEGRLGGHGDRVGRGRAGGRYGAGGGGGSGDGPFVVLKAGEGSM